MASKYNPIDLANDASQFAVSRFGQHYLDRLRTAKERELKKAMDSSFNDSYRAHAATKASAVQDELDYFDIAKGFKNSPELIKRLSDKLKGKDKPIV